jgi:membrane-associated HD superfamily phosphohydrolase
VRRKTKAESHGHIYSIMHNNRYQRVFILIITIILAFMIIENGSAPKRYKLYLGEASRYDITSPRDIENKLKTEQVAKAAAEAVPPIMKRLGDVPIDVLNDCDNLFVKMDEARDSVLLSLQGQGITSKSSNYRKKLENEQAYAAKKLKTTMNEYKIPVSDEQVKYLISKAGNEDIANLEKIVKTTLGVLMKEELTEENITSKVDEAQKTIQQSSLSQDMITLAPLLLKTWRSQIAAPGFYPLFCPLF